MLSTRGDIEAHNFLDKVPHSEFLAVSFERKWLPSGCKLSPKVNDYRTEPFSTK